MFALAVGKGFKIIGVRCEGSIWKDNITNSWFLNPMGVDLVPLRFLRNSLDNRNKINRIKEFTERIFNIGTSLCYLRAVLLESSKFIIFLKHPVNSQIYTKNFTTNFKCCRRGYF